MYYILSEQQLKRLFEQSEKLLEPNIIRLFQYINQEKKDKRKRAQILDSIKTVSPYLGIPKGYEIYLLELFLLNYRPDGDYAKLTKENFIDPRKMKGKWTSNTKSNLYTRSQLPFKGSSLEGYWTEDNKGVPYYVVKSWGWYPIYLFKENKWYEVLERYSTSTGRQMNNANPEKWNDEIESSVILVTKEEMKELERYATFSDIIKSKRKKLKSKEKEFQNQRMSLVSVPNWRFWDEEDYESIPSYKVKFKINSIDDSGEKVIVNVDIYDVVLMKDGRQLFTVKNYMKGEIPRVTPQLVEKSLLNKLNEMMKNYIGASYSYDLKVPTNSLVEYKFRHLKA